MDPTWWDRHIDEVAATFTGARTTSSSKAQRWGATRLIRPAFRTFRNSGCSAISLAAFYGAKRIIMVGYDLQFTDDKKHWHGDHPGKLGNCGTINEWPSRFAALKKHLNERRVHVVNSSRSTALKGYRRVNLEDALGYDSKQMFRANDNASAR